MGRLLDQSRSCVAGVPIPIAFPRASLPRLGSQTSRAGGSGGGDSGAQRTGPSSPPHDVPSVYAVSTQGGDISGLNLDIYLDILTHASRVVNYMTRGHLCHGSQNGENTSHSLICNETGRNGDLT